MQNNSMQNIDTCSPAVSIVIPVYNVEKYLRQCLDSAKNQTMTNIEIICIDDGSTDNSGSILDEYASQDKRFVVIHQPNAGQSVARNKGIELAQGEYIAFLDSDDWLELDMCRNSYLTATKNNSNVLQFQFYTEGDPHWVSNISSKIPNNCYCNADKLCCISNGVIWNRLYKREFLEENGIRFLSGYNFEDNHFVIKVALFVKQIDVIQDKLLHYRCGVGYSFTSRREWFYLQHLKTFIAIYNELQQCKASDSFIQFCRFRIYNMIWGLYLYYNKDIHNEELISIIHQIQNLFGWTVIDKEPLEYQKIIALFYLVYNRKIKYLKSFLYYKLLNPFRKLYKSLFTIHR